MPEAPVGLDRAFRSVALGLAGVAGTFFTFGVSFPPHEVTVVWSLFLPLVAALAYGFRSAVLASTLGGVAFLGFWLWPTNGWGNLAGVVTYGTWFLWHGWCADRRRERAAWWNGLYVAQTAHVFANAFIVFVPFPLLFRLNPPFWSPGAARSIDSSVLASIVVKDTFFLFVQVFAADVLLHLPPARRALGLPVAASSRLNVKVLGAALVLGGLVFGLSSLVESALIARDLPNALAHLVDEEHRHQVAVILLVCLGAGLQLVKHLERRLEAETALKAETSFVDAAINALQGVFFVVGPDGRYERWNTAMARLWGREGESLRDLNALDLLHADDRAAAEAALALAFEKGTATLEARIVARPAGEARRYLFSGRRFESGGHAHVVGSGIDVTELREAESAARKLVAAVEQNRSLEEQLRHAQKMEAVGVLAGGVAHDFNNLLCAIEGFGSLLRLELPPASKGQGHVAEILSATDRATELTRSLLAFSRQQPVSIVPLDVGELVTGFKTMLGGLLSEKVELKLSLASSPLVVGADRGQLEQVLLNLATNARDAMPAGGALEIATERVTLDAPSGALAPGAYALVTVSDTGTGMDAATLSRIFEPFFTTKEVGRGTGLGLSIVYGIVKRHGGLIRATSEPGRGTRFFTYLPLLAAPVTARETLEPAPLDGGTETILFAEDNASVRRSLRLLLEQYGYTVLEATDGADAVRVFRENETRVQLVLCDLLMPRLNGKEACEEIRRIRPGMRVLFVSGYGDDVLSGSDPSKVISKPVHLPHLLARIRAELAAAAVESPGRREVVAGP
jgi:PAS domain S-box-containing protein